MIDNKASYSLAEKKAARFIMLEAVYNISEGSERVFKSIEDIANVISLPETLTRITYEYLMGEGLLNPVAFGNLFYITHEGIKEYESATSNPENETTYFPPVNIVNNILNIERITGSQQIQIGTDSSSQNMAISNVDTVKIQTWIEELEKTILNIEFIRKNEILEEIETVKSLLKTSKPKNIFLNSSLNTIKNILIGVASNTAFQLLLKQFPI